MGFNVSFRVLMGGFRAWAFGRPAERSGRDSATPLGSRVEGVGCGVSLNPKP